MTEPAKRAANADRGLSGRFWADLERRIHIEWLVVSLVLSALTALMSCFSSEIGLARLDHTFYDNMLTATADRSRSSDIVIVAIDDSSIEQIGYWPWRRGLHAALLERLGQARAVGLDIVFTDANPAYPGDDAALAEAIARNGRVVLPTLIGRNGESTPPLASLASAARALGYINIEPDNDGVIRSVRLRRRLETGKAVNHFCLAMLAVGGKTRLLSRLAQRPGASSVLIPYTGAPGHFTIYPYTAVLSKQVPASAFKDKFVIVGSWGTGLGDTFPTPLTRQGKPMAGVEILANILQGALDDDWIRMPPAWATALLCALPVLLLCLFLRRLSPRRCFFVAVAAVASIFLADALLLRYASIWIAPTASLIGIILAGPVWSWRTQEAALQHIDRELLALQRENELANAEPPPRRTAHDASLATRVIKLHDAIDQIRRLRKSELKARRQREETLRFISHDMRSPQNSILALSSLQSQPQTRLPEDQLLQRIDHYAGRTLALVDGFTLLARAESMRIQARPIDLVNLIDRICDDYWALSRQRGIEVAFQHETDTAYTEGDESTLMRAFGNLLDNAIKYSADGTRVVYTLAGRDRFWRIRIADQGRGIAPQDMARVFAPFSRLDENAPGNPMGTGLGLAFVKTVVERHGGTIEAASRPGEGSAFTVELPAAGSGEP